MYGPLQDVHFWVDLNSKMATILVHRIDTSLVGLSIYDVIG
jgi:hypothetical protein